MVDTVSSINPEQAARKLQLDLLKSSALIWPGEQLSPLDMCDPWAAARLRNIEVQEGWLTSDYTKAGHKLGGFINRTANLIGVDVDLRYRTKLFTLAHEIGHLEMHPELHHHREIPVHGLTDVQHPVDRREHQANQFAGFFLVPTKQLRIAFEAAFGVRTLQLTDQVAWELLRDDWASLINSPYHSLAFARCVGRAQRYCGREFGPLHDLFKVSETTMAIRLKESGLVSR
jgi:hypothetical protein